jgi:hypothetical protein
MLHEVLRIDGVHLTYFKWSYNAPFT